MECSGIAHLINLYLQAAHNKKLAKEYNEYINKAEGLRLAA